MTNQKRYTEEQIITFTEASYALYLAQCTVEDFKKNLKITIKDDDELLEQIHALHTPNDLTDTMEDGYDYAGGEQVMLDLDVSFLTEKK
jgi:hypothetical protein